MENLSLSQNEWQVIIGGLLGDSYFNKKKNIIRFQHSDKQLDYLNWKFNCFNKEYTRGIYKRNYNDGRIGYNFEFINKHHDFQDEFNFILKHLYTNNGRKKISMKILNELSPLGLAIWWMDDGCLSVHRGNRYGKLCTHCFNYEEHILIQKYFKEKWDIDVKIKVEKQKYHFIYFNVHALKKFIRIIYKYIAEIPSMLYKIDLDYSNQGCIGDFNDVYFYIKEHRKQYFIEGTQTTAGRMWQHIR